MTSVWCVFKRTSDIQYPVFSDYLCKIFIKEEDAREYISKRVVSQDRRKYTIEEFDVE